MLRGERRRASERVEDGISEAGGSVELGSFRGGGREGQENGGEEGRDGSGGVVGEWGMKDDGSERG